jgi:hypothetical protein
MRKFVSVAEDLSNADCSGLFDAYFKKPAGKLYLAKKLKEEDSTVSQFVEIIRLMYDNAPIYEKKRYSSIIASILTRKQANSYGFSISKRAFATAKRHAKEFGAGMSAPCPAQVPISNETILKIEKFLKANSSPKANCSKKIRINGEKEKTIVPVYCLHFNKFDSYLLFKI